MVDPRVVEKPRDDGKTERLAAKFPGIFPASVVTRSMKAKKEAIKEQVKEEIGLSGTFLENTDGKFEESNKEMAEKALMRNESRNVKENIPGKQEGKSKSVISRQNLIEEQSNDKELLDLFKIALTPVKAKKGWCWIFNQGKYIDKKVVLAPCYYYTSIIVKREMA